MTQPLSDILHIHQHPKLNQATMVLAFTGWLDGGDVSTGTVRRLVDLLEAKPIADIEPEPFYIYNFPGSMEVVSFFRPAVTIKRGQVQRMEMPASVFFCHEPANLVLFIGKEPNLQWQLFGEAVLEFTRTFGIQRVLFVGSFGGPVPHTREPRLYATCSNPALLPEMQKYGLRPTEYEGPGSFPSYLLTQAPAAHLEMTSIVAEIPGYLQGRNPTCIEAVTRRLAKILHLPLNLEALRTESTEWEVEVSKIVEGDRKLAKTVRDLEKAYDDDLLRVAGGEGGEAETMH
jgi:proteasome assembly chaperone (PAC2) family protein